MRRAGLRVVLVVLASLLASMTAAADRVALVVGIGKYAHATPLPNPANDASAIAASLTSLGFEVIEGLDLDKAGRDGKVREFAEKSFDAKVALFFYAGHGVQANGRNYLIPTDATLETFTALDFEAVELDSVLKYTAGEGRVSLAFIDACRDNPFVRSLGRGFDRGGGAAGQGLAMPQISPGGMLIAYATSPGATAADGTGVHSPFTQALLAQLATPGLEVQQMMTRVKAAVFDTTGGRQEPWHNSSLRTEYYFVPAAVQQAVTVPTVPAEAADTPEVLASVDTPEGVPAADELLWRQVGDAKDINKLRLFIESFPDSAHAKDAKWQVANLLQNTQYDGRFAKLFQGRFAGEAERFIVVADGAIGRDLPEENGPAKVTLSAGDRLLTFARLGGPPGDVWLPVKTTDGTAAFVRREDVVPVGEYEEGMRKQSRASIDELFERVVAANGPLRDFAGTWSPGTACPTDAASLAVGFSRVIWSEREGELLQVAPGAPDEVEIGTLKRYKKIKIDGAGSVQFYHWDYPDGTKNIVGFKGDKMYYPKDDAEKQFGFYTKCSSGDGHRELLGEWMEKRAE